MLKNRDVFVCVMIILVLLAGCGEVKPTATPPLHIEVSAPTETAFNSSETPKPLSPSNNTPEATESLVPDGSLGDTWIRPSDGMLMVYVPAGEFEMGSDENDPEANAGESPQHTVNLDGFWMDLTEVTNAHYTLCVDDGVCRASRYASSPAYNGDDYPVVGVAWQDAVDYCTWAGGRLPTEAEWEYTARGPEESRYPWGDTFDGTRVNFCDTNCRESWADTSVDDGHVESAPVGSYSEGASWAGTLDMAGNVWEWVWEWYVDYSSDSRTNPTGPDTGTHKVIRGGCWANGADGVRTTYRIKDGGDVSPSARHPNIGFRCVASVALPTD